MVFGSAIQSLKDAIDDVFDDSDDEIREERDRIAHPPPQSTLDGTKKAVFIGINYRDTPQELRGCINDVENISRFVFDKWGFSPENAMILTDDVEEEMRPTKRNIVRAMDWLVKDAQPGDSLMWHYSGHGHQLKDESGDEEDGMDEVLVPLDFRESGMITDDEIFHRLVEPVPEGVRLTIIMDCCHSGSIVDLPFTYQNDGNTQLLVSSNSKRKAILNALSSIARAVTGDDQKTAIAEWAGGLKVENREDQASQRKKQQQEGGMKENNTNKAKADVIMFSGCRDDQTSADAVISKEATGAMSHALVKAYNELEEEDGTTPTYARVLAEMRKNLKKGNYTQVPQMSTGRLVNLETSFKM